MFFVLLILYFIFVGSFTVSGLIQGVIVAGLLTVFCRKFVNGKPKKPSLKRYWKRFLYFCFLVKEIFLSNVAVIKKIYASKPVKPHLVRFKSDLQTEGGNVLVANSITLTPGTYTCELSEGEYVVHGLDADFTDGIESNDFLVKVKELEALNG